VFEVSAPVTPSVFVIELHRQVGAARPPWSVDLTRSGSVVEIAHSLDGRSSGSVVRLHLAANSAGSVVSLEVPPDEYSAELARIVETLMQRTAQALAPTSRA